MSDVVSQNPEPEARDIPLVLEVADLMIGAFYEGFVEGTIDLPPLDAHEPAKRRIGIWRPNQRKLGRAYAIGVGRSFERKGTIVPPSGPPMSVDMFQLRFRIFSHQRVKATKANEKFQLLQAKILDITRDNMERIYGGLSNQHPWLAGYRPKSGFSSSQFSKWFNYSTLAPPFLLTESPRKYSASQLLQIGDPIVHGDAQGKHAGVVSLYVRLEGKTLALSTAHVVSFNGQAALQTNLFRKEKGQPTGFVKVGAYFGPENVIHSFAEGALIECDAAMFDPVVPLAGNKIRIRRKDRVIESIRNVELTEANDRPPVIIVRQHQQLQLGEISAVNAFTPMVYDDDQLLFYNNLIELRKPKRNKKLVPKSLEEDVRDATVLTRPGDSGSLVISISGNKLASRRSFDAIGIVIGGNAAGGAASLAYAAPLTEIQARLKFELHETVKSGKDGG